MIHHAVVVRPRAGAAFDHAIMAWPGGDERHLLNPKPQTRLHLDMVRPRSPIRPNDKGAVAARRYLVPLRLRHLDIACCGI